MNIKLIDFLQAYSQRLRFLSPVLFVLIFITVPGVIYCLVSGHPAQQYLIPGIVTLLWFISVYSLINIFPFVPNIPSPDVRFFLRVKIRIKRFFFYLLALLFLLTSTALISISVKLINIWISHS